MECKKSIPFRWPVACSEREKGLSAHSIEWIKYKTILASTCTFVSGHSDDNIAEAMGNGSASGNCLGKMEVGIRHAHAKGRGMRSGRAHKSWTNKRDDDRLFSANHKYSIVSMGSTCVNARECVCVCWRLRPRAIRRRRWHCVPLMMMELTRAAGTDRNNG